MKMTGAELRSLRKQVGLTQAQMAAYLHLSPAFVGEMERGEKAIEPRTADLATRALAQRVMVGTFGDKYVVVATEPIPGLPGRASRVLPPAYDTFEEAQAAATGFSAAHPGWRYVRTR